MGKVHKFLVVFSIAVALSLARAEEVSNGREAASTCRFTHVWSEGVVLSTTTHEPTQTGCGWTNQYVTVCLGPTVSCTTSNKVDLKLLFGFTKVFIQLPPEYACEYIIAEGTTPQPKDRAIIKVRQFTDWSAGIYWFIKNPRCVA